MTETPPPKTNPPTEAKLPASEAEYMLDAIEYVRSEKKPHYLFPVSKKLFLIQGPDADSCQEIQQLLLDYIKGSESKPISIVVFGPPGSGKSFYAKELLQSLRNRRLNEDEKSSAAAEPPKEEETFASLLGELTEINLAQLYTPLELSKRFHAARKQTAKTKAFFFDEFDSSLEGVSLGWLRWFLAPMQDGKFSYNDVVEEIGKDEEIGKSIFVFAGGTAATFNEFQERARIDPDAYREKKVPDFISRLRGYINVRGINDPGDDRPFRRAFILRSALSKKGASIGDDSVKGLLSNAHYIHGTRSLEALIEMSPLKNGETFDIKKHLPPRKLMELHVSRGALNGMRVGISAGLNEEEAATDFLIKLSGKLFENGADMAYGGNLGKEGTLAAMVKAQAAPKDLLERKEERRIRNYLGYPAYHDPELIALNDTVKTQVQSRALETISDSECEDLGLFGRDYFPARPRNNVENYNPKHHLAWSLSLFRMRVHMIQDLNALIVFGGKDDGQSWGRFSGIAEEIMLALALKKPVYVMGKAGGAGLAVGKLLGLGATLVNPDTCLADIGSIEHSPLYKHYRHAFVLPEQPNLPRTVAEVRNYLFEHGVTSSTWPWNGLTPEQNRQLFSTELTQEDDKAELTPDEDLTNIKKSCISLIIEGLTRLDWKKQSRNPQEAKVMGKAHSAG